MLSQAREVGGYAKYSYTVAVDCQRNTVSYFPTLLCTRWWITNVNIQWQGEKFSFNKAKVVIHNINVNHMRRQITTTHIQHSYTRTSKCHYLIGDSTRTRMQNFEVINVHSNWIQISFNHHKHLAWM